MSDFLRDRRTTEEQRERLLAEERIAARDLERAERTARNARKAAEREMERQARMAAIAGTDGAGDDGE